MSENLATQLALLPDYLSHHMLLTLLALGCALVICLPLGMLATRVKPLEWLILTVASVLQTVPGIALLALMVPLLGTIGFLPALVALFVYSTLPILRNTVTGIQNVDPVMKEAADGLGMTSMQRLLRVELPLATPVIIAGIRTSTVWVVGTATLSTPVGATSLGNYIFSGLQTQNYTAVLIGCLAAAALAVLLDQLIRLFETAAAKRTRAPAIVASVLLAVLVLASFAPAALESSTREDQPRVVVGAKTFTEQYILADLIVDRLDSAGFKARANTSMGSTILFDALKDGSIDCYVDYSGTIWANIMKLDTIPSREEVLAEMTAWLKEQYGIVCLGGLGFENTYALAMRESEATRLGISTVTDLSAYSPDLAIGSDYEFFDRPEWRQLKTTYGLEFRELRKLDPSLMYSAVAEGQVDVISAYSTDGRIAAYDLRVLGDPLGALPPYDAVLLLSPEAAKRADLVAALSPLVGSITDSNMRQANKLVDIDSRSIKAAARFLNLQITPESNPAD
jgi:osmoprotectant transport system permease protein